MRYRNQLVAASLAGFAMALSTAAAAQTLDSIAREINGNNEQRGCVATDKVYGEKFIVIDGYRYGGCLPVGADKNMDAMRVLIKAAQGTGQWRDNRYGGGGERYLVIGDTSTKKQIVGKGTWNGQPASIRMDWDYRIPGLRFQVTRGNAAPDIWVATDPRVKPGGQTGSLEQPELFGGGPRTGVQLAAWKEKTPGTYAGPSDIPAEELLVLAYLMPSGVVDAGRRAAATMKASKAGTNDVLTIPVPALGADLVARMDAMGRPAHTEINLKGKAYSADFANFVNDRGDYEVYFPLKITIRRDNTVIADWDLEYHHTNPYLIFPVPAQVAAK
jgi:hypothetical protein